MTVEIQALWQKQATSVVALQDRKRGFYSAYFLVLKKMGHFRPILYLRLLNTSLACKPFCTLNIKQLLGSLQLANWFATTDLKNAYFHTKVGPR